MTDERKYIITEKQIRELDELFDSLCAGNCCGEFDFDSETAIIQIRRHGTTTFEMKFPKIKS